MQWHSMNNGKQDKNISTKEDDMSNNTKAQNICKLSFRCDDDLLNAYIVDPDPESTHDPILLGSISKFLVREDTSLLKSFESLMIEALRILVKNSIGADIKAVNSDEIEHEMVSGLRH